MGSWQALYRSRGPQSGGTTLKRLYVIAACAAVLAALFAGAGSAGEFRGAWLSAWNDGYFTAEQIDNTIAAAKKANLTALFIQVRKNGDAYYKSQTEPRGNGIADDFDPLATVIEKAHAQGLEVHAWVNSCRMWASKTPPTSPKHIVNRHPEWINKNFAGTNRASEGLYVDPGIPEAREYVAGIFEEIAKSYNVDGVHMDYIRYPNTQWGYSDLALKQYYADTGATTRPEASDPKFMQWKRDQVTALVTLIRKKVKAAKPNIVLSASTIPWGDCPDDFTKSSPYAQVCQDWRKWAAEGLIDANCPMNYKQESSTKAAKMFRNWLAGFAKWRALKPVYVGIEVHMNNPAESVQQIEAIRKANLDGFVLFSFNQSAGRTKLVEALAAGPCSTPSKRSVVASGDPPAKAAFDQGIKYAVANRLDLAKQSFGEAVRLDPSYTEAYFRLGRCMVREMNYVEARGMFEKTLQLDPSHKGAQTELKAIVDKNPS